MPPWIWFGTLGLKSTSDRRPLGGVNGKGLVDSSLSTLASLSSLQNVLKDMSTYTHTHTRAHTHIHTCPLVHTPTCVHILTLIGHVHARVQSCAHVFTHTCFYCLEATVRDILNDFLLIYNILSVRCF